MTFAILSFKYEVSLEICPLILFADVSGIFREKIYLKRLKIAFNHIDYLYGYFMDLKGE